MQKVDILYQQLILPEIFSRELKNTLLIEKQVKLTLNQLVTTVCEQEKGKIDPDLFKKSPSCYGLKRLTSYLYTLGFLMFLFLLTTLFD